MSAGALEVLEQGPDDAYVGVLLYEMPGIGDPCDDGVREGSQPEFLEGLVRDYDQDELALLADFLE
ncbi:hypothetical protein ER308_08620 [Egibacter rhizosphaerae]|uniref:Uncharacterized protein n=1 Tax=Egibacter rhizosphaerae TaxID=1670831 RepID=A0A411YEI1_9ACTN|nr:hypothetical protein [Egibacter rhizosphaerae]QBI19606.1 hypothetical protein ER308_08620 [Egibacter rhizosphaerae]